MCVCKFACDCCPHTQRQEHFAYHAEHRANKVVVKNGNREIKGHEWRNRRLLHPQNSKGKKGSSVIHRVYCKLKRKAHVHVGMWLAGVGPE